MNRTPAPPRSPEEFARVDFSRAVEKYLFKGLDYNAAVEAATTEQMEKSAKDPHWARREFCLADVPAYLDWVRRDTRTPKKSGSVDDELSRELCAIFARDPEKPTDEAVAEAFAKLGRTA